MHFCYRLKLPGFLGLGIPEEEEHCRGGGEVEEEG